MSRHAESNLIRRALDITGWSAEEMARRVGLTGKYRRQTISSIALGKKPMRPGMEADLRAALRRLKKDIEAALDQ